MSRSNGLGDLAMLDEETPTRGSAAGQGRAPPKHLILAPSSEKMGGRVGLSCESCLRRLCCRNAAQLLRQLDHGDTR